MMRRDLPERGHWLAVTSFALGLLTYGSFLLFVLLPQRPSLLQFSSRSPLFRWAISFAALVPYACSIGAVVTGRLAKRRVVASRDPTGAQFARSGLVLGSIGLILLFVLPLLGFAFLVLLFSGGTPH
jgi:hypothetical protein